MLLNCSSEMSFASWPASAGCNAFHTPSTSHQASRSLRRTGLPSKPAYLITFMTESCAFSAQFLRAFVCASTSRYLGVNGNILAVDLPHKLGAKFNCLFKLLFGLAL